MSPLNEASDQVPLLFLNSSVVVFMISCVGCVLLCSVAVFGAARTSYQISRSCRQLFYILFTYFHISLFFKVCSVHFVRVFYLQINP
jgi:hypothetical protein